jgi:hypothetical protein
MNYNNNIPALNKFIYFRKKDETIMKLTKKRSNFNRRIVSLILSGGFAFALSSAVMAVPPADAPLGDSLVFQERGLPELFQAVQTYGYDGEAVPAEENLENLPEGVIAAAAAPGVKAAIGKLVAKVVRNGLLTSASLTALVHFIKPGMEAVGGSVGLGLAGIEAAFSIYKTYSEIMAQKAAAAANAV